MRLLPAGSDPWGSLGSREAEYARVEDEGAPKAVVDEKSLQGGKSVAASVEMMLRERYAHYGQGLGSVSPCLRARPLGSPAYTDACSWGTHPREPWRRFSAATEVALVASDCGQDSFPLVRSLSPLSLCG